MIGHPLKVNELLEEIARGEVLLPEIQRSYVWKGPQVTKLLDSLYREYPTGQILLWDTDLLPVTKVMRGIDKTADPLAVRPKIVLDGQQRLTSLHKALGKGEDTIEIYFNLDTEQFQRYLNRLKNDPLWISVRAVINNQKHDLQILKEIKASGGPDLEDPKSNVYLDRLQKLKKIGEYKYPIEIFKSNDYEEATELFVRINSAGTHLRTSELALAQLALHLPGTLVDKFDVAIAEYEGTGYELDARFLIRALIAVGTGQSRFRYLADFWKKTPVELRDIWNRTKKGVDAAVNFVRHNARFETSDWLPSLNTLIPLTRFFSAHQRIAGDVEGGLLRWFYVASLRGRYSTSPETAMDEDLKAVLENDPVPVLMHNTAGPGDLAVATEEFDGVGERNPLFAMTYAVARKRHAKDWFKGVALSTDVVGEDNKIHVHHIFPRALLRERGVNRSDINEIANLAFLSARPNKQISSRPPEQYLAEIAAKHPERLVTQSIPMDKSLWKLDRFDDFRAARRTLLAEAVNELIKNPQ
jgi:hypothetical protein